MVRTVFFAKHSSIADYTPDDIAYVVADGGEILQHPVANSAEELFEAFLDILFDTLQTHPAWKLGPHDTNQTVPVSIIWNIFNVIFDVYKTRHEIKKETVTRELCEGISKWGIYLYQQCMVGSIPERLESDWAKFFLTFETSLTFLSGFDFPVVCDWIDHQG